jgi:4-hydroxy-tetrahydrodipicolinate reductase
MPVIVVGAGKLATELLDALAGASGAGVIAWAKSGANAGEAEGSSIVVHAGSGRELDEVIAYCQRTGAVLVELATGSPLATADVDFPVVLCPNTNILMLKFMAMLARSGQQFKNYRIALVESHQAAKTSAPGTAVSMAKSLGLPSDQIVSIRDPAVQEEVLKIPPEHIARHAYHGIVISDDLTSITLETRVFGPAPYAAGLAQIIAAVRSNILERRRYDVVEFVENGWI